MNLVQLAPTWIVALFGIALLAAAAEDILRLRISNLTIAAVLITAAVAAAVVGPSMELWQNFALFAAFLAIGTGLFAAGWLGGGDVKLLAAVALWVDLKTSLFLVSSVFLVGGLLALLFIFSRIAMRRSRPDAKSARKVLPYGVAIAAGALVVVSVERAEVSARRANPLELSTHRLSAVASARGQQARGNIGVSPLSGHILFIADVEGVPAAKWPSPSKKTGDLWRWLKRVLLLK